MALSVVRFVVCRLGVRFFVAWSCFLSIEGCYKISWCVFRCLRCRCFALGCCSVLFGLYKNNIENALCLSGCSCSLLRVWKIGTQLAFGFGLLFVFWCCFRFSSELGIVVVKTKYLLPLVSVLFAWSLG